MSLLNPFAAAKEDTKVSNELKDFLTDFSIEVMPRTSAKIESFTEILPKNTRVYIFKPFQSFLHFIYIFDNSMLF